MSQPTLYLMLGYPGAGKTTVAQLIAQRSGAAHLWADAERHELFDRPTHAHQENLELYDRMNAQASELLAQGQSVVFDASFNLYSDRQKLRDIADQQGADTLVVWINTPEPKSRERALHGLAPRNGYVEHMEPERFETLAAKLESPREDEKFIKIDGTKLDETALIRLLKL